MFKRYITFTVNRDGMMKVADTLSTYGHLKVKSSTGGKNYLIGMYCDWDKLSACLDNICTLIRNGVGIQHINIQTKIRI